MSITNNANGKTVSATVADACPGPSPPSPCANTDGHPGCSNFNSIDLSVAAFNAIADPATGVIGITWSFTSVRPFPSRVKLTALSDSSYASIYPDITLDCCAARPDVAW